MAAVSGGLAGSPSTASGGLDYPAGNGAPMAAILTILVFLLVILGLNFFEFGRGD
jgi:hypothetical protein